MTDTDEIRWQWRRSDQHVYKAICGLCDEIDRLRLALESVKAEGGERQPVGPPPWDEVETME